MVCPKLKPVLTGGEGLEPNPKPIKSPPPRRLLAGGWLTAGCGGVEERPKPSRSPPNPPLLGGGVWTGFGPPTSRPRMLKGSLLVGAGFWGGGVG